MALAGFEILIRTKMLDGHVGVNHVGQFSSRKPLDQKASADWQTSRLGRFTGLRRDDIV